MSLRCPHAGVRLLVAFGWISGWAVSPPPAVAGPPAAAPEPRAPAAAPEPRAPVETLVFINQVYGGAGSTYYVYASDYVELFNAGITTVDVTGWSIQYASATGSTWQVTPLTGSIPPGRLYLVRESTSGLGMRPLPAPDVSGTIAMSATNGKVALVNSTTALSGTCPMSDTIVDFIGYGTANCYETTPAPAVGSTNAAVRLNRWADTDVNADDFVIAAPLAPNSAWRPARFDYTGDATSDVVWWHDTRGEVYLWPMSGAARLSETFVRTVPDTNFEIRGLGDQTGEGNADLLWRNTVNGQIYFWPMNSSAPLGETHVATVGTDYDIVGNGDFNGDGKSDILWRNLTNGEVWIWLMDGATPLSQTYVGRADPDYVVRGVGDFDGDLKADIVFHHETTGEVWVWLMNGATRLSETFVAAVADTGYQIQDVADFTGDLKGDILWRHTALGDVWVWLMDGTTKLSETWVGSVPDTGYQVVRCRD